MRYVLPRLEVSLCLVMTLFTSQIYSQSENEVLHDDWMRISLNGGIAGYVHTVVADQPDGTISTWAETRFNLARMGTPLTVTTESTLIERQDGTVVRMSSRSEMPGKTIATGVVDGDTLRVTIEEPSGTRKLDMDWDSEVRGSAYWYQQGLNWLPNCAVGDTMETLSFTLDLGKVVLSTAEVVGRSGDVVELRQSSDVMPGMVATLFTKVDGTVQSTEMPMMGMSFRMERCSKEEALDALASSDVSPEVFAGSVIRANHPLPRPRSLDRVMLRMKAKDLAIPFPDFESERQRIVESSPGEIILDVRRVVPHPDPGGEASLPGPEYLEPNATLQSDDPDIVALSEELAAGAETPWDVARQLESGVFQYIDKKSFGVAFASAAEVCRSRSGDCSEHAVLLAAVARAQGLPSRVAMGLVYVGGIFGGHAWTEVWVDGRWIALDATLGLGFVDPSHIRFGASSLEGLGMGSEMISALLGLTNLEIEVLETERNGVVRSYGEGDSLPFTVDGRTLSSDVYGVRVEAPDGYTWDTELPDWMSGRLARASGPDGQRLDLYAIAIAYDFSEDDLVGEDQPGKISIRRTIDGRPAFVGERSAWTLRVLDGDTVFRMDLHTDEGEDEALETLLEVAATIEFID
ncbi:MAG: transglutaminase-like domain-containing protein [Planctomycetota bacterium]|jgi:hypothetical protein|nr:transglutaminase-like domain-containing protein [Planctomycetota bacterium]